jgi:hypothetical protein
MVRGRFLALCRGRLNYRANKTIPAAGDSLYIPRAIGIVFQHLPDLSDRPVNAVVGIEKNSLAPNPLDDLVACNQFAILLHQKEQDFRRNALQFQDAPRAAEFLRTRIKLEIVSESDRN